MNKDDAIDEAARHAGDAWAVARRAELAGAGRVIGDGWPGTISEARALVAKALGRSRTLSYQQLDRAARIAYRTAREAWRLMPREPPTEEPP
jgi:hypothetical protein